MKAKLLSAQEVLLKFHNTLISVQKKSLARAKKREQSKDEDLKRLRKQINNFYKNHTL